MAKTGEVIHAPSLGVSIEFRTTTAETAASCSSST